MSKIVGHTTEDVSTLPRWAQRRIDQLTKEVEHWQSVAHSTTTPGTTNVSLIDGIEERSLPTDSRVRFYLDPKRFYSIDVELHHDDRGGGIQVRSNDGSLSVQPMVSNVIDVRVNTR